MAYFPNNTVANFRVKLAETLVLPRQWEVALTELHYPHTWSTVRKGSQQTFMYNVGTNNETGILNDTNFTSVSYLVKAMNASLTKEAQTKIKFTYNRNSRDRKSVV